MIMECIFIGIIGLCLGSFINALVWRLYQQETKKNKKAQKELSILQGRSMCPHCKHQLAPKDLVPLASWLWLRGKCRYCSGAISVQYPAVELLTAGLLVLSYITWPYLYGSWNGSEVVLLAVWGGALVVGMALAVYDIRWYLLPNRLVSIFTMLAVVGALLLAYIFGDIGALWISLAAAGLLFMLFYGLYWLSGGKWIGGGDVKLAPALGLLAGGALQVFLLLFLASVLGTLYALLRAAMTRQPVRAATRIPFGPFLLIAAYITFLYADSILNWYTQIITTV